MTCFTFATSRMKASSFTYLRRLWSWSRSRMKSSPILCWQKHRGKVKEYKRGGFLAFSVIGAMCVNESGADLGDDLSQPGVAHHQPAAGSDAVGLVLELVGLHFVEVLETVNNVEPSHPRTGFVKQISFERHRLFYCLSQRHTLSLGGCPSGSGPRHWQREIPQCTDEPCWSSSGRPLQWGTYGAYGHYRQDTLLRLSANKHKLKRRHFIFPAKSSQLIKEQSWTHE